MTGVSVFTDHLDHGPAALLRYIYDGRRSGAPVQRLLDMGMLTRQELHLFLAELERNGLVHSTRQGGAVESPKTGSRGFSHATPTP